MLETHQPAKKRITRLAKNFLLWNGQLFSRTGSGLRAVPAIAERANILKSFHDEVDHWDAKTTRQFITERYWWPLIYRDIHDYVKSCEDCLKATPLLKYRSTLRIPLRTLFDLFSVEFAGPFKASKNGMRFVLVGVEHLTGWPLARATRFSTAETGVKFVKEEILLPFGPQRIIVSDNGNCFHASALVNFMEEHGIIWKTILANAPMSNGRAERMVGTLKRSITKMVLNGQGDWEKSLGKVLYCYRRRRLAPGNSPFELLYGVPRMKNVEAGPLFDPSTETNRSLELLSASVIRTGRVDASRKLADKTGSMRIKNFSIGEEVLVAKGILLNPTVKWPAFTAKYYGPCRVISGKHPRYTLLSPDNRISRKAIHARRLIQYRRRPAHLFA